MNAGSGTAAGVVRRINTPARANRDTVSLRQDFPILQQKSNGVPLAFLDSAASAQKPQSVIDAISNCYRAEYANIHRGVYELSARATARFEEVRGKAQHFIGAKESREIIFLRSTTEAINLVASAYGRRNVGPGDEVLITAMEHHSNIVPWQMLCEEKGARLRVAPIDDRGALVLDEFEKLLSPRTQIVAVTHVSNALGTLNPLEEISRLAHAHGAVVLVDGAQAVPHQSVNVRGLDCDFYAFSGHKMFGPSGVGVLYGKASLLQKMPPYQGGGSMIRTVTFEKTSYEDIPQRFEAGTPDIAGVIGLGAAFDYLADAGLDAIAAHDCELLSYATHALNEIPGLRMIGTAPEKVAVLSFVLDGVHPHDVGTILDREGVAVRAGHHCAQPLMERLGVTGTVRASLALYNNHEDVDALIRGLATVRKFFA